MFRIRIGLNTDLDPAFEVNTPAIEVNTDPDPGFFMTTFYQFFFWKFTVFVTNCNLYVTSVKDSQVTMQTILRAMKDL